MEAIEAGKDIDKVLIRRGLSGELFNELFAAIRNNELNFQFVPEEKLNTITRKAHQGIIAFLSPVPIQRIESIIPGLYEEGQVPFILALDGITDVRNLGAISRSAECAGVQAIVLPEKGSAQLNADAMKTSAGALNHIAVCRSPKFKASLQFMKDSGVKLIGATEKAVEVYYKTDFSVPVCLVMGGEDTGISPEVLRMCDELVRIPISGRVGSLNVANAASVLLFEGVRQRALSH